MAQYRILIAAKDRLARSGLAALISETMSLEIVGQSVGGVDLPDDIDLHDPDIVLYDLGWNPVAAVNHLKNISDYDVPVIALIPDESDAREINMTLMAREIYGLLLRDSEPDILIAAIGSVVNRLIVIDPSFAQAVMQVAVSVEETMMESLTPREDEVLQLLARGLTNKAIAQKLNITEHTVKYHVTSIMGKLNAQSRTDAVIRATKLGLIIL